MIELEVIVFEFFHMTGICVRLCSFQFQYKLELTIDVITQILKLANRVLQGKWILKIAGV